MSFKTISKYCFPMLFALAFSTASYTQKNEKEQWTDTDYPDYITKVTDFGERADWSHDGKRILFVERSFGDVYEYNLETGKYKPLTHHYYHGGYVRALYLSNGDILLSGVKDFPGDDWKEARFRLAELWILDKDLDKPPVRLGEFCWEGPAASRTQLRIAWAQHHGLYPDNKRHYALWVGDIDYSSGTPQIINQHVVLNNTREEVKGMVLEPQNFIPGKENELTVQAYPNCEVYGLDYTTGELTNYSNAPDSYDEPEGIFPDGTYTLVESSRHNTSNSGANIDLWKLKLNTNNPDWERLTWFNEGEVYKASNPVVSDDGRHLAFQVAGNREVAGIGHGIYVMDLVKAKKIQTEYATNTNSGGQISEPAIQNKAKGFKPLFNGKDFKDWELLLRNSTAEEVEKVFTIDEDGTLHFFRDLPKGSGNDEARRNAFHGVMATKKSYSNYHLKFEYKWGKKLVNNYDQFQYDAGVFYHIKELKIWPVGLQYQIRYNHITNKNHSGDFVASNVKMQWFSQDGKTFKLPSEGGTPQPIRKGQHYAATDLNFNGLNDKWNTGEVIVMGNEYALHFLNGKLANMATDLEPNEGPIAFEAETGEIFWRNIEIKEFKKAVPMHLFLEEN